jgi:SAM-dependent methyltransferase
MTVTTVGPITSSDINDVSYRLSIRYESDYGQHSDNLYVQQKNIQAVIKTLPAAIRNDLKTIDDETSRTYDYIRGKLFNNDDQVQTMAIAEEDFIRHPGHNINIEPRYGRFYPATLFNSEKLAAGNIIRSSMANRVIPVRIIDLMYKELLINTSHPLCNYNTTLTIERLEPQQNTQPAEAHNEAPDAVQLLNTAKVPDFMTGPGMQLRYGDKATDFFSDDAFQRVDETIDSEFYSQPRHINHLDEAAQKQLKSVYNDLIPPHSEILDLMSSINSHIDDSLESKKITGLGMNEEELAANPRLDEIIVHDINQQQRLPFEDASFDIIVCSLSIEYVTRPSRLFDEVARLLRPGGRYIISFSNRWFPTKAVQVWNNLHDFERIGLVMEHFIASAHFGDINTWSLRGIPRPANDKHNIPLSDPIYVVWADRE